MFADTESQIEGIKEIFAEAEREEGWKVGDEMLYSYYFVDKSVEKLEKLGLYLEKQGYDFINVFELGEEETGEPTGEYLLHIDKVEKHTPESLAERNSEFQRLANEYEIESYDGWEFGEEGDEDEPEDDLENEEDDE